MPDPHMETSMWRITQRDFWKCLPAARPSTGLLGRPSTIASTKLDWMVAPVAKAEARHHDQAQSQQDARRRFRHSAGRTIDIVKG
jgi:hypothetical protein